YFSCVPDPMRDLTIGTPLMPLTRYNKGGEWWISIHDGKDTRVAEHTWMARQAGIRGEHVHHVDGNHENNVLSNLKGMRAADHARLHGLRMMRDETHPFLSLTPEHRAMSAQGDSRWFN